MEIFMHRVYTRLLYVSETRVAHFVPSMLFESYHFLGILSQEFGTHKHRKQSIIAETE